MKLSDNTLSILKNFASINQGIVVKPGKQLRTISSNKAILAQADVEETFPNEFGVYDLNMFLQVVDKNSAEVQFEKTFMVFKSVGNIQLRYTEPTLILTPPNKNINAEYDVSFDLSQEHFNWIFSMASVLKCPNIVIKGDEDGINISAIDVKGEIVHNASVKVADSCDNNFQAVFKIDNFKILPGAYKVELSSIGVGKFTNASKNVTYWIALEKAESRFGA
jgi:hypothetical protein